MESHNPGTVQELNWIQKINKLDEIINECKEGLAIIVDKTDFICIPLPPAPDMDEMTKQPSTEIESPLCTRLNEVIDTAVSLLAGIRHHNDSIDL